MRAHLYSSAVAASFLVMSLIGGQLTARGAEHSAKPGAGNTKGGNSKDANPKDTERRAAETVEQALTAEADGQPAERTALLRQAIQFAPGYAPARWQAGLVRWQGKWQPVDTIAQAAARDPQRLEYARLRDEQQASAEGERELAGWCLKHKLDAEARYHLRKLLEYAPDDAQALRELSLHPYEGELLSKSEIAARKKEAESRQHALVYWKPRLAAWRRDLESSDDPKRDEALSQIRAITDVEVIGPFEAVLADKEQAANSMFEREMIGVLANMKDSRATFALVREAALSQWPDAQQAATTALKRHELTDYVPYALGNMLTLVASKYVTTVDPNGTVHYQQHLKRQRATADDVALKQTQVVPRIGKLARLAEAVKRDDAYQAEFATVRGDVVRRRRFAASEARWNALVDARNLADLDEAVVGEVNHVIDQRNEALRRMLSANTGTDQGTDPHAWWDWWTNYNELLNAPTRPVNFYEGEATYYEYVKYNGIVYRESMSCFIAGTPVCTLTGERPIETIRPGDRVLAEDPQTGELAFQMVLATTIRPASPTRKLRIGGESIVATRGHRFWQVGRGWQMAKQLQPPAALHGLAGALPLESADESEDAEAYNLVVADFHTYFVGNSRILVHDNSAPKPLLGPVPGLVQKDKPTALAEGAKPE